VVLKSWFLAGLAVAAVAQTPRERVFWKPDPSRWSLKVEGEPGGWVTDPVVALRLTLVDPARPEPPAEWAGLDYWDRRQARQELEARALEARTVELLPEGSDAAWSPASSGWEEGEGWSAEEGAGPVGLPDLARLIALRRASAELAALHASRQIQMKAWFNGESRQMRVPLGEPWRLTLRSAAGENRLVILSPVDGSLRVFTWYHQGRNAPLAVRAEAVDGLQEVWGVRLVDGKGRLHDLEDGTAFDHPEPGTWTVQWQAGQPSRWWDASDAEPRRIRVSAVLHGGTDRERIQTFECLALPGTGLQTLGSFDVDP
jgi:hypothetical protein